MNETLILRFSQDAARTALAISETEARIGELEDGIEKIENELKGQKSHRERLRLQAAGLREAIRIMRVYAQEQEEGAINGSQGQGDGDQDS